MSQDIVAVMAGVRQLFKGYASCCIQQAFGLWLPLNQPEIAHKHAHIKFLLKDLQYLKTTATVCYTYLLTLLCSLTMAIGPD